MEASALLYCGHSQETLQVGKTPLSDVDIISSDRGSGRRPSKNKEARERRAAILATTA